MQDIENEESDTNKQTTNNNSNSRNNSTTSLPLTSRRRRFTTPITDVTSPKNSGGYPKEEEDEDDVDIEEEEEEEEESEESEQDDSDEDYDDGSSKRKRKTKKQILQEQEEQQQQQQQATLEANYDENVEIDVMDEGVGYSDEGDDEGEEEEIEEDEEDDDDDMDSSDSSGIDDTYEEQLKLQQQQISSSSTTNIHNPNEDQLFQTGDPGDDFLIPIRLDIQSNVYKIGDYLLWNLNEREITPEHYSKRLCIELDYPEWFEFLITNSINQQISYGKNVIKEFRKALPKLKQILKECIVTISLDLNVNGLYFKDRFEWDIIGPNLPESFAKSISMDLGLSREFENIIVYSIREQIQGHYAQITHQYNSNLQNFKNYSSMRPTIQADQVFRNDYQLSYFTPTISYRQPPKVGGYDPPTAYFLQQNHIRQQNLIHQQQLKFQIRPPPINQQHPQQQQQLNQFIR